MAGFRQIHGDLEEFNVDLAKYPCVAQNLKMEQGTKVSALILRSVELATMVKADSCRAVSRYSQSMWTRFKIGSDLKTNPLVGEREIAEYLEKTGIVPNDNR